MNKIYEIILKSCSDINKNLITEFKNDNEKMNSYLKSITKNDEHSFNMAKSIIEKYKIEGTTAEQYINHPRNVLEIIDKETTIKLLSTGEVQLALQKKFRNKYICEIVIEEDCCIIKINEKRKFNTEEVYDFYESDVYKLYIGFNRIDSIASIIDYTNQHDFKINSILDIQDKKTSKEIMVDIIEHIDNYNNMIDLVALKYDTNALKDDLISIMCFISKTALKIDKKPVKNKL